ncbi:MAG: hypothetical protein LBF97_03870 [Elusimicrobiota bacterium]|jgi:hypothetical protein|nr:hypothetical protein [Elusimicrobiota bacterium]
MVDNFYTKKELAKYLTSIIKEKCKYKLALEPSAGDGSFSNLINCIAIDIDPKNKNIIKQDFLTFDKSFKDLLVFGNPPFGKRSNLAKKFIKKSIKIGANYIAFILPSTFEKLNNQIVFPNDWKLIFKEKIPKDSFEKEGKTFDIPCIFYIWTNMDSKINLREENIKYKTDDFIFLQRGDNKADFVINGNNGKIKKLIEVSNPKAEHYIKCLKDKENVINNFNKVKYTFFSSISGKNAWINQQEIIKEYINSTS